MFGSSIDLDAQNLHIESLQNRAAHQSRQYQGSAQITVGYGVSGSGDFSHSQIRADHTSVAEQSGLFAGDGGYRVNVQQHTDLKGGLITSTAKAEAEHRNRFQTATLAHSDIQNHSRYSGTGFGIGAAGGFNADLGLGSHAAPQSSLTTTGAASAQSSQAIGFGRDSDKQSSVTRSGINTQNIVIGDAAAQQHTSGQTVAETIAAVKTDINTDNAAAHSGRLNNRFEQDKVQKELDVQREVTQQFGSNAAQAVAATSDYLGNTANYERAEMLRYVVESELAQTQDPAQNAQLQEALSLVNEYLADNQTAYHTWKEGGIGRSLLHAGAGGILTGDLGGALAAGSTSLASPYLNQAGGNLGDAGKAVLDTFGGAAIGWAADGNVASAAAGANADWFNRQLHPQERVLTQKWAPAMQQLVKNKEGKNISLSDAELRLQKQILRWVNKDSIDGYTDEAAISIIGMKGHDANLDMSWNYRRYAQRFPQEYSDKHMNKEYFPNDGKGSNYWRLNWLHSGRTDQAIQNRSNTNRNLAIGLSTVATTPIGIGTTAGKSGIQWLTSYAGREAAKNATIGGTISAGSQLLNDRKINPTAVGIDAAAAGIGSRFGFKGQAATNVIGSVTSSKLQGKSNEEVVADAVGTLAGTGVGYKGGNYIQKNANNYYNPLGRPDWVYKPGSPLLHYNISETPRTLGTVVGGISGEGAKNKISNTLKEKNEK